MAASVMPVDWLVPDWPAPPGVRAVCTTRAGGMSLPPYQGLNLGSHVGDCRETVMTNRSMLQDVLGCRPVFLEQVHGVQGLSIDENTSDGLRADFSIASRPDVACTTMVADCLPILFATRCGTRVAAAHAGWRGLAAGVLEEALNRLAIEHASPPMVWLGPCIGAQAFEVGDDVKDAFESQDVSLSDCFRATGTTGKWWADLARLARRRLHMAGVESIHGNDSSPAWCTVSNPLRFFSHRRDGVSGRFVACIWIAP